MPHVANFATEVTFSSKPSAAAAAAAVAAPNSIGRIPTISTCTTMIITAVLWASRRVLQGLLPRAGKPHSAISTVSQRHGMTNISRVPQHHMALHILLSDHMQICQQQIVGTHEVPNFKHDSPELLVVPSHRGPLPQVKQAGLVAQGMVQIPGIQFQQRGKSLTTYTHLTLPNFRLPLIATTSTPSPSTA